MKKRKCNSDFDFFREVLRKWYLINKRTLPWRDIHDPYRIWVSEIILQQTRVDQAMDYYLRFIERFPSVKALAMAEEDEVLKYWQGLGYYSRARNLHFSANRIMEHHNGIFPRSYSDVLALKGVGEYTAAAICSFAYGMPYAVLDGNVYRFISRYFGESVPIDSSAGKKVFNALADALLDTEDPALHNQAMMEMGALQCVPVLPDCRECPFHTSCVAFSGNQVSALPVKEKSVKIKERFFYYVHIKLGNETFLQKRIAQDIWKNLYEFPLIETDRLLNVEEFLLLPDFLEMVGETFTLCSVSSPVKHVLSHQHIYATLYTVEVLNPVPKLVDFIRIAFDTIYSYPVSRLMEIFIEKNLGR